MPAAQLAWYVNGEKADDVHLRTYPDETTIDGLKTSRLGLTFKVRAQSYDPNPPPRAYVAITFSGAAVSLCPQGRLEVEMYRHHLHCLLEVQRGECPGIGVQRPHGPGVRVKGSDIR